MNNNYFSVDLDDQKQIWHMQVVISNEQLKKAENPKTNGSTDPGKENTLQKSAHVRNAVQQAAEHCWASNKLNNAVIVIDNITDQNEVEYHLEEDKEKKFKTQAMSELQVSGTEKPDKSIRIVNVNRSSNFLELFQPQERYTGRFVKVKKAMDPFFTKMGQAFTPIAKWWGAILKTDEKSMHRDMAMLADVTGFSPKESVSMKDALNYMRKIFDRYQGEYDPALKQRLAGASEKLAVIYSLRKDFAKNKQPKKEYEALVAGIRSEIRDLKIEENQKLLVPVGFTTSEGKREEMLMEVQRTSEDQFTVTLLNQSGKLNKYFERTKSEDSKGYALRRVITEVKQADLEAVIPTLIALQVNPRLMEKPAEKIEASSEKKEEQELAMPIKARREFVECFRFPGSKVESSSEEDLKLKKGSVESIGKVHSLMHYMMAELPGENQDSADIAFRMRTFLDLCKKTDKWIKDPEYQNLVKATGNKLLYEVYAEKEALFGGEESDQGRELTKIIGEIRNVLDRVDATLPDVPKIEREKFSPTASGQVPRIDTPEVTPPLESVPMRVTPLHDVATPLVPFDRDNPVEVLKSWAQRCQELETNKAYDRIVHDAALMTRMLPEIDDEFWNAELTENKIDEIAAAMQKIGHSLAMASIQVREPFEGKVTPSRESALASCTLATLSHRLVLKQAGKPDYDLKMFFSFLSSDTNLLIHKLFNSSMDPEETLRLDKLRKYQSTHRLDYKGPNVYEPTDMEMPFKAYNRLPHSEAVQNLEQQSQYVLFVNGSFASTDVMLGSIVITTNKPERYATEERLVFTPVLDDLTETMSFNLNGSNWKKPKLSDFHHPPAYASHLSELLQKRMTQTSGHGSEFFTDVSAARRDYQVANFPKLVEKGYTRGEISDLCYLQHTNQAHRLHEYSSYETYLYEDDRVAQAINAFNCFFLQQPQLLDKPDMQWLLESKLFYNVALDDVRAGHAPHINLLFKDKNYAKHGPFLLAMFSAVNRQVQIASSNGEFQRAAYCLRLSERIRDHINASDLPQGEKQKLTAALGEDALTHLIAFTNDYKGKGEIDDKIQQNHILTNLLILYSEKINKDPKQFIPIQENALENICYAYAQLQSNHAFEAMDQESKDKIQGLFSFALADISKISQESNSFVNHVLNGFQPKLAEKNLSWKISEQGFPLFEATDSGKLVQFDISNGTVFTGGARAEFLSSRLLENAQIKHLFPNAASETWQVQGVPDPIKKPKEDVEVISEPVKPAESAAALNPLEIGGPFAQLGIANPFANPETPLAEPELKKDDLSEKPEKPPRITVYTNEKHPLQRIVVRETLQDDGKLDEEKPPLVTVEREVTLPNGLKDWAFYHQYETQKMISKGEIDQRYVDLPVSVASAVGGRDCWLSRSQDAIHVFDRDALEPYAVVSLAQEKGVKEGPLICKSFRLHDGRSLLFGESDKLIRFSALDSPQEMALFGVKGHPSRVEYPRLKLAANGSSLSYENKKGEWSCRSFEGWKLAPYGMRPGKSMQGAASLNPTIPEGFSSYHLLLRDGAEKVLIPSRQLELDVRQPVGKEGRFLIESKQIISEGVAIIPVYEFDVNPQNQRLESKTADGYFYLTYVSCMHKDYAAAAYYLNKANSATGDYSAFPEIFDWMDQLKDPSPNGQAMKCKLEIFREKILQGQKFTAAQKGEAFEDQPLLRMKHLSSFVASYEQYRKGCDPAVLKSQQVDPALRLDAREEEMALLMTTEILMEKIDEAIIETPVATTVVSKAKAIKTPDLQSVSPEGLVPGISDHTFTFNQFLGKSTELPFLGVSSHEALLEHFPAIFNALVKEDKDSVRFKELVQFVRLARPAQDQGSSKLQLKFIQKLKGGLFLQKQEAGILAQDYLLKLAAIKMQGTENLTELLELPDGKLPILSPPFIRKRQLLQLMLAGRFLAALEGTGPPRNLQELEAYKEKLKKDHDELPFFAKKLLNILGANRKLKTISSTFEKEFKAQSEQSPDPKSFTFSEEQAYQIIINCIFGKKNATAMVNFDRVIQAVSTVQVDESVPPVQETLANKEDLAEAASDAAEATSSSNESPAAAKLPTYGERYEHLLRNPPPIIQELIDLENPDRLDTLKAIIQKKEKDLGNPVDVSGTGEHVPIMTPDTLKTPVLGASKFQDLTDHFQKSPAKKSAMDAAFFIRLETSTEKAVARLAREHRQDFVAFTEQDKRISKDISRRDTEKTIDELTQYKKELSSKQLEAKKNILQAAEKWNTPAGILMMKRLTGESSPPSLDFLLSLWRKDELTKPWNENPLKALGGKPLSTSELQVLDNTIKEYLQMTTELGQLDRTIAAGDSYLQSCGKGSKSIGDGELSKQFYSSLTAKREYSDQVDYQAVIQASKGREDFQQHVLEALAEKHPQLAEQMGKLFADGKIDEAVELMGKDEHKDARHDLEQELKSSIEVEFRYFLSMEYSLDLVLRGDQVETLREMLSDPNVVRQLGMGAGKSKVLLPLLAARKATGRNLVALILPDSLYETNRRDLDATNRKLFGQEMFCFEFHRNSDRSEEAILQIYDKMLDTIANKGFMATTKNSLLSFRNSYLELVDELRAIPLNTTDPAELEKRDEIVGKMKAMGKVLKLVGDRMDGIGDEVDELLNTIKETNFSLGEKTSIDPAKSKVGTALINLVLKTPKESPLNELKDALLQNKQAAIPPEKREKLMEDLAEAYFDTLKEKNEMKGVSKEFFVQYVTGKPVENRDGLPEFMHDLKRTNYEEYKAIASAKGLLSQSFASAIGRVGNVNYGRDPISGTLTIPFKAKDDPSIGSEFDADLEKIAYTLIDYAQKGAQYSQVFKVVAQLRKSALEQMQGADPDLVPSLDYTDAGKEFADFIASIDPKGQLGRPVHLSAYNTEDKVSVLTTVINQNPISRVAFCENHVLPTIEISSKQVSSKSEDLVDMVHGFSGFSGTPWNIRTYHDRIKAETNLGVDGRTYALLLEKDIDVMTGSVDTSDPVTSVLQGSNFIGKYQAFIDVGSTLKGTTNEQFVSRVMESAAKEGKKVSSGIYFDESGRIVKKKNAQGGSVPIESEARGNMVEDVTLYDRFVGADIKQAKTARALVTIGENTTTRDLFQGVWRMRELHLQQGVDFFIPDKGVERLIMGDEFGKRKATKQDILAFCAKNLSKEEANVNYISEGGKINGAGSRTAFRHLVDLTLKSDSDDDIHRMAYGYEGVTVKRKKEDEEYNEYALVKVKDTPQNVLEAKKATAAKEIEAIAENLVKLDQSGTLTSYAEELKGTADAVRKREKKPADWMQNLVDSSQAETGREAEVQAEAELEVEAQTELQLETQKQKQVQTQIERVVAKGAAPASAKGQKFRNLTLDNLDRLGNGMNTTAFKEAVGDGKALRQFSQTIAAFDDRVFTTATFENYVGFSPNKDDYGQSGKGDFEQTATTVFYTGRLPVHEALFIHDNGEWRAVIGITHENHGVFKDYIEQMPVKDANVHAATVTVSSGKPVPVYKTGDTSNSSLPFDEKDLPGFFHLYVQVKFFAGMTTYATVEEKDAMKAWIKEKGVAEMRTLFEERILLSCPGEIQQSYVGSSLYRIFNELSAPTA